MKKSLLLILVAAAVLAVSAGPAAAGGYRIPEAGAKAMAMGNAFVGQADDASAVQFNPAGLTQLEGNRILTGFTSITTNNDYDDGSTKTSAEEGNFLPPFFYYTNHLEGLGSGNWWLGLGITSPFGLGTDWDVDTFNYIATETTLELLKYNPVASYRVNDKWSVALGLDYYQVLEANFQSDISSTLSGVKFAPLPPTVTTQELSGDGDSFGYNFGALFKASDSLAVGLAYRAGTEIDIDGDVDINVKADGSLVTSFPASTTLKLPATFALGVNYRFSGAWQLNVDMDWTGWSQYDKLEIKDSTGALLNPTSFEKNYDDTIAWRVGVQYTLNDNWALRGGFLMEPTPVPDETYEPRLPDGDRMGYSIGCGFEKDAWTVDLAYMLVLLDKHTVDSDVIGISDINLAALPNIVPTAVQEADGTYEGDISLIGLSVGYRF